MVLAVLQSVLFRSNSNARATDACAHLSSNINGKSILSYLSCCKSQNRHYFLSFRIGLLESKALQRRSNRQRSRQVGIPAAGYVLMQILLARGIQRCMQYTCITILENLQELTLFSIHSRFSPVLQVFCIDWKKCFNYTN